MLFEVEVCDAAHEAVAAGASRFSPRGLHWIVGAAL